MTVEASIKLEDSRPVVLVIDDSQDVHRLLKARLRSEELTLLSAVGGAEGLITAGTAKPAIILLDLDMPGMDGFEVLRSLKDSTDTAQIPVIVLSALSSPQDKVTAFDLGAVDYITKPFDLTELRVRVRAALKMHALLQILSQRAKIDGLTGLWNRAYFDERWREEVARAARHDRPLTVAVMDVDHFKSVNDTFGHPAGDAVLMGLGKLVQRSCRASDIPCRYGGEEFVLIMPDTTPEDAATLCERLRQGLMEIQWPRHPERSVTMSIGIAGASAASAIDPGAWVEAADRNLYAAKKGGRNRVVWTSVGPAKLVRAAG